MLANGNWTNDRQKPQPVLRNDKEKQRNAERSNFARPFLVWNNLANCIIKSVERPLN